MRKLNITILVGLVVAVLGFGMVFAYGRNVDEKVADGRATRSVLVASGPIQAGASADQLAGAVRVEQIPAAYVPETALSDLSQVAGTFALGPIASGAQLSSTSFGTQAQATAAQGGGAVTPSKGKVAVAISTDLTQGVANYITAGSTVDLFVTYGGSSATAVGSGTTSSAARATTDRTKLFVSGVKVLSVTSASAPSTVADGTTAANPGSVNGVLSVLDLSPTDAERVINATLNGRVYMALSTNGVINRTPVGASANDVLTNNR